MTVNAVAAVLREKDGPFSLEEVTLDEPRPDEVLVRIRAVGVCHTDLFCRAQGLPVPLPLVLGHEGAGVVERVGAGVTKVAPGDHVVLSYASCGKCPSCDEGQRAYCGEFFPRNFGGARIDGTSPIRRGQEVVHGAFFGQSSFASFAIAAERNVVKVRTDVPLELLGPLGCGVQTGAGTVLNALRPRPGSTLAIFGVGSVGLSAVMAARVAGCATIVAVDLHRSRLALAQQLGATHVVDAAAVSDVPDAIRAVTGGLGVQYAIDTTAVPRVLRSAVDAMAPRGVCAAVGAASFGTDVAIDAGALLAKGQTLRGVVEGESLPDTFIPALIELYRQQAFPFDRLITRYPFHRIDRAIADAESGAAIKPVLVFE
jgi:aryl-alcohol dehydrogenase